MGEMVFTGLVFGEVILTQVCGQKLTRVVRRKPVTERGWHVR